MKVHYYLTAVLMLGCFTISFGQETNITQYSLVEPNVGTYQIVITTNKFQPVFTTEIGAEIEKHRLNDVDYTWQYSDFVYIIIPSRKKINDKNFVKLPQFSYGTDTSFN